MQVQKRPLNGDLYEYKLLILKGYSVFIKVIKPTLRRGRLCLLVALLLWRLLWSLALLLRLLWNLLAALAAHQVNLVNAQCHGKACAAIALLKLACTNLARNGYLLTFDQILR
jgi:hypothetical protein